MFPGFCGTLVLRGGAVLRKEQLRVLGSARGVVPPAGISALRQFDEWAVVDSHR